MALFAKINTYPPLAQVTIVPPLRKEFNFTVCLESSKSLPESPWEVSIWYDHGSYSGQKDMWRALDLERTGSHPYQLNNGFDSSSYQYTFSGNLPSPFTQHDKIYKGRRVPFTVRYRIDSNSEWVWVYHNFNISDGELILQPPIDPNFLAATPVDLKQGWTIRKLTSEAPGAKLYSIDSSSLIPPVAEGEDAVVHEKVLGRVLQICRWFALVRIWSPWLAPKHGEQKLHLTEPAVMMSFLRADGLNVVLLAVNGVDDVLTTFGSNDEGEIVVHARNDTTTERKFRILAATAWQFEVANAAVMYEARKLVRSSSTYLEAVDQFSKLTTESVDADTELINNHQNGANESTPQPQWQEYWYDGISYCTWNSLGQDLNAEKIMSGLDSLAKAKIHISTLIIDDNWQSLDGKQGETRQFERGWKDFEANREGFPNGLKAAITTIREKYPAIRDIAVWHALMGYWGAISPGGSIAKNYETQKVSFKNKNLFPENNLAISPSAIHKMYDDFYRFLASCGITGVKTDAQFMLDELTSTVDRRSFTSTYQSAWAQAYLRHLSGHAISCMSMIPQILYYGFMPTDKPRITLRNSDDFFPDVATSHPWHVFCNAHNAVFVQHLNALPDWDMFQTSHPYSGFHAAARCVSGGPIYITDTPGQHNIDLLHQMTAINPRGQTVILRPSSIGKTVGVYDKYDAKSLLKIGVWDGKAEVGTGIIGLFNLDDKEITFMLPVIKFPGVTAPNGESDGDGYEDGVLRKWIVRSHVSGTITKPITPTIPIQPGNLLRGKLGVRGYDIWSAIPVRQVELALDGNATEVAVLGLLGKMTGACAIVESKFRSADNGKRLKVQITLKALGRLGVWLSDGRTRKVEDLMVMIQGKAVPEKTVKIRSEGVEGDEAAVVEVDVESAWNEMKLDAGWSNEVGVEILIG